MNANRRTSCWLILLVLSLCSACAQDVSSQVGLVPEGTLQGPTQVVRVVDGDTVRLVINGVEENARLIGIDTPETVHPSRPIEPYGPEASAFMNELLEGQRVWIEFDVEERDRYRRSLVYVYLEDAGGQWSYDGGRFTQANLAIAQVGLADVLTIPPNVRYSALYLEAVREARAQGLGMWEGNVCIDLNTATLEELQGIVHIGGARAQEIIALRPFMSVGELNRLSGVGPGRIADIKAQGLACVV